MAEKWKNQRKEAEQISWTRMADMEQVGYWCGSNYRGQGYSRLEVNMNGIEAFCRYLDLPPIQIVNAPWQVSNPTVPDVLDRGLAVYAAESIRPTSERDFDVGPLFEFVSYEEPDGEIKMIPVGYTLGIKSQKIDYEYPEDEFVKRFNEALLKGMSALYGLEITDVRANGGDRFAYDNLTARLDTLLSAVGVASANEILHLEASLIGLVGSAAFLDIPLQHMTGAIGDAQFQSISRKATEWWRSQRFPDRHKTEPHGGPKKDKFIIRSVPYIGGMINRELTVLAAKGYSGTDFVRLPS